MAILGPYRQVLGLSDAGDITRVFLETLIPTNKTYDFFVNWEKVRDHVEALKFEISVLNAVCGSRDVESDLRHAIRRHPEVVEAFPIILAVRNSRISVLDPEVEPFPTVRELDFSARSDLEPTEIEEILNFCRRTGITALFASLRLTNLRDYLLGVEVGMDTNARKNRSGTWMENQVEGHIAAALENLPGSRMIHQKTFGGLAKQGIQIPSQLRNRQFDLAFLRGRTRINIEVNYYGGGGSKPQEIIDSYINRQDVLRKADWRFILITDGFGWKAGQNQLRRGVEEFDFIMNLHFVRAGLLVHAIQQCARQD
ncbi:MAG TPA: type II restriction endonuclease [Phycisphaerae bacterium]|nr:type II restriction endonuclease [Phycisphaerae bacterium]